MESRNWINEKLDARTDQHSGTTGDRVSANSPGEVKSKGDADVQGVPHDPHCEEVPRQRMIPNTASME